MQPAQPDLSEFQRAIHDLLNGQSPLPMLPPIAGEIREAIDAQNISMMEFSRLLARDAALTRVLLRYASSPIVGSQTPPQTLLDVIRLLGMSQVERIAMVHFIKDLFNACSLKHKRLHAEAWRRLALKASLSTYIAKELHVKQISPDKVLMAALLSELGALGVLTALNRCAQTPDLPSYIWLCRAHAKTLGLKTLKLWEVDELYLDVVQGLGRWSEENAGPIRAVDVLNLGLYHTVKLSNAKTDLPPLQSLTAFQKLNEPHNKTITGGLELVMVHIPDIQMVAKSLF